MLHRQQRKATASMRSNQFSTHFDYNLEHPTSLYSTNSCNKQTGHDLSMSETDHQLALLRPSSEQQKMDWEFRYQSELHSLAEELDHLNQLRLLSYSKEDVGRQWQNVKAASSNNNSQEVAMATWGPPAPPVISGYLTNQLAPGGLDAQTELASDYLADIYSVEAVMEESDLPPVYTSKKDSAASTPNLKRTASEAGFSGPGSPSGAGAGGEAGGSSDRHKSRKDGGGDGLFGGSGVGASNAPRSLFDRQVNQQKLRLKSQQRAAQRDAQAMAAGLQMQGMCQS